MFLSITEEQNLGNIADQIVQREREVYTYQLNIDNYTHILQNYPEVTLSDDLLQYLGTPVENIPENVPLEDVIKISSFIQRKYLANLIRTENIEQSKSKRLLEALKAQIPAEQLEQLVADAAARFKARQPQ